MKNKLIALVIFVFLSAYALYAVSFAWDTSSDPTVVGYRFYYGGSSRTYTNVADIGSTNFAIVSNLTAGATYYFAVTAYTAAGLESDFSAEISYTIPTNAPPTGPPGPPVIQSLIRTQ